VPRIALIAVAVYTSCVAVVAAADRPIDRPAADGAAALDQQRTQGRWTREFTNPQRVLFRVEKVVDGNRETVTTFDTNGNTIES
jgi:hypothetical protein